MKNCVKFNGKNWKNLEKVQKLELNCLEIFYNLHGKNEKFCKIQWRKLKKFRKGSKIGTKLF